MNSCDVLGFAGKGADLACGLSGNRDRQGAAPVVIGRAASKGGGIPGTLKGFGHMVDEFLDVFVSDADSSITSGVN